MNYMQQNQLVVAGAYIPQTEAPVVTLCGPQDFAVTLTPEQAMLLGSELMQTAMLAINEAVVVSSFRQHLGMEPKDAFEALEAYRASKGKNDGARY